MGQATEETIQQFSAAIEQDVHEVLSWQQMVASVQLEHNVEAYNTEQLSSDHQAQAHVGLNMGPVVPDPEAQDHVGLNMDPLLPDSPAQEGPSVMDHGSFSVQFKVDLHVGLSGRTNNQISRIFDVTIGQHRSNTIYRLRFLAFFNLVFHVIAGVPYLFEFLHGDGVHVTYLVMFIITVGAPIVVVVISLLVSYWPASDLGSDERSNWITGLLVANFFLFGGRLAFNWVPTQGTGN